ncbi:hypothetical protein VSR34_13940 [Paraburkholderia sp. JHI2823]|uniref:hypothetical protein n=1 Tax=Paraburkholderia TaxID=1822464 RepID=UPI0012B548EC|nr:hypothetical protein [Paraburkholderia mimosarum]
MAQTTISAHREPALANGGAPGIHPARSHHSLGYAFGIHQPLHRLAKAVHGIPLMARFSVRSRDHRLASSG